MSYVFKQFENSNVSVSSFKAYKTIQANQSNVNVDGAVCIYQSIFKPSTTELRDSNESTYSTYKFLAYNSLYNKYYRDYLRNPHPEISADQKRYLGLSATIFSVPQNLFGEQIKPGSVAMTVNGLNIIDDCVGNLICTNYVTSSIYDDSLQKLIGRWVFNDAYIQQTLIAYDYSPFNNDANLYNVTFTSSLFNTGSDISAYISDDASIEIPHINIYNADEFVLSFNIKSTAAAATKLNVIRKGAYSTYPFNVYVSGSYLFAEQSNGLITAVVSGSCALNTPYNFTIVHDSASLFMYSNGVLASSATCNISEIFTSESIYIGNISSSTTPGFTGYINEINYYNSSFTPAQCALYSGQQYPSQSFNYNIGNVFYTEGIIAITSPYTPFNNLTYDTSSFTLQCNGTKTIYEYEYICTVKSNELTLSTNPSTYNLHHNYLPFVSHSEFSPIVTTVGLYNDKYDLIAVAKLSKPVKMAKNHDINFVVRFDL